MADIKFFLGMPIVFFQVFSSNYNLMNVLPIHLFSHYLMKKITNQHIRYRTLPFQNTIQYIINILHIIQNLEI